MENEQVYENNFISSNDVEKRRIQSGHIPRQKVIIAVDNLRCSAFKFFDNQEDPDLNITEDEFEILEYWPARPYESYTPGDLSVIKRIEDSKKSGEKLVMLIYGTYTVQTPWTKKRFTK